MFRFLLTSLQIRFSLTANRLVHFLRRIPLIKEAFPDSTYGNYSSKTALGLIGLFFTVLKRILIKLLVVGSVVIAGVFIWFLSSIGGFGGFFQSSKELSFPPFSIMEASPYILTFWFVSLICNSRIQKITLQDEVLLKYLRMNPKQYARGVILWERIWDLLLSLPCYGILIAITELPLWSLFVILPLHVALRLMTEGFYLMYFQYGKRTTLPFIGNLITSLFILAVLALNPEWLGRLNWTEILKNPLVPFASLLIGVPIAGYIHRYPYYSAFLRERVQWANEFMEKVQMSKKNKNPYMESVKKWSSNVGKEDLKSDKHANKKGFSYLNAIFFDRHRRFFRKKLSYRYYSILGIGLLASLFGIVYSMKQKTPLVTSGKVTDLFNRSPIFIFVIYFISMGRVVTASFFSNCDVNMLHYPYYRTKETIFASFKARFAYIMNYNLRITSLLFVMLFVSVRILYGDMDFVYAWVFFLLLTCIGIFFSFNDLFLYYVIQPYDYKGQTKSIAYRIIDTAIYMIAYLTFSYSESFAFLPFSILTMLVIVLYIGIGTGALLLFASKNFKLR